jgi:uncharacterized protein
MAPAMCTHIERRTRVQKFPEIRITYAGAGQVDWLVGVPLALGGIAAISAGVAFASRLPERRARLAFCALLLLTAVLLALRG